MLSEVSESKQKYISKSKTMMISRNAFYWKVKQTYLDMFGRIVAYSILLQMRAGHLDRYPNITISYLSAQLDMNANKERS